MKPSAFIDSKDSSSVPEALINSSPNKSCWILPLDILEIYVLLPVIN